MSAALLEAVTSGRTDVLNSLLSEHGNDIDVNDVNIEDGNTALHYACISGSTDCVRCLLRHGASVSVRNRNGELPYDTATDEVQKAFFQELLQHVATGNLEGVKSMIRSGVDLNQSDGTVNSASLLHWAASFGQPEQIIKLLVENGADPNIKNANSCTPLHEAVINRSLESAEALINAGAKVDATDGQGKTPIDYCLEEGDEEMHEVLLQTRKATDFNSNEQEIEEGRKYMQASEESKNDEHQVDEARQDERKHEVEYWKRIAEEKDIVLSSLRETIETLVQEKGILRYVKNLQEEISELSDKLENSSNKVEHISNLYRKQERELETALKDNATLRSAIHDKEDRLLRMLEEKHSNSLNESDTNINGMISNENSESEEHSALKMERDRLASELENERRLRYEEARIHLAYANELRKELELTRQQLDSRTMVLQEGIDDPNRKRRKEKRQSLFELIYYTIWPFHEEEETEAKEEKENDEHDNHNSNPENENSEKKIARAKASSVEKDVIEQDVNLELNII